VRLEVPAGWTAPWSSNPVAVAPLGGGWFVAAAPGTSVLSVDFPAPRGTYIADVLWHGTVEVRFPGT
jgi:hypothetical protein